jgi:hypothetical protein
MAVWVAHQSTFQEAGRPKQTGIKTTEPRDKPTGNTTPREKARLMQGSVFFVSSDLIGLTATR